MDDESPVDVSKPGIIEVVLGVVWLPPAVEFVVIEVELIFVPVFVEVLLVPADPPVVEFDCEEVLLATPEIVPFIMIVV